MSADAVGQPLLDAPLGIIQNLRSFQREGDIPYIDIQDANDIALLPPWLRKYPLYITIELINRQCCIYCVLRFLGIKTESYYVQDHDVLRQQLFPTTLLNSTEFSSPEIPAVLLQMSQKLSKIDHVVEPFMAASLQNALESSTTHTDSESNDTHSGQSHSDTSHTNPSLQSFDSLVHSTCTLCLNLFIPNPDLLQILAQYVDEFDYEFIYYSCTRTTPSSLYLRQMGMWFHLKHLFQQTVPHLQSVTYDGFIVDLKEAFRFSQPLMTATLESLRLANHKTANPNDPSQTCRFYPHKSTINTQPIKYHQNSPFKVNIAYYLVTPDYMRNIHSALYKHEYQGEISLSSNVMRSMNDIPYSDFSQWGVSPPIITSCQLIPHVPESSASHLVTPHIASLESVRFPCRLDYLPAGIPRYPSYNEHTFKTIAINPFVIIQVNCFHESIFFRGRYQKLSRLLSQTSWYGDLALYQKTKQQQQEYHAEKQQQIEQLTASISDDTESDMVAVTAIQTSGSSTSNNDSITTTAKKPRLTSNTTKKKRFESLSDSDDDKTTTKTDQPQAVSHNQTSLTNHKGSSRADTSGKRDDAKRSAADDDDDDTSDSDDDIVSIDEHDPLFTGEEYTPGASSSSHPNGPQRTLMANSGGGGGGDDGDGDGDDPQGSLPYAESSVDFEIAYRILPYFHPIRSGILPPVSSQNVQGTFQTGGGVTAGGEETSSTQKDSQSCSTNSNPVPQKNDPYIPHDQHIAGYCSVHSTNPNGIPCSFYHPTCGGDDSGAQKGLNKGNTSSSTDTMTDDTAVADTMTSHEYNTDELAHINTYRLLYHSHYGFKFHASGREDLNVRMLNSGRLFCLEICDPHRIPSALHHIIISLLNRPTGRNKPKGNPDDELNQVMASKYPEVVQYQQQLLNEVNAFSQGVQLTQFSFATIATMNHMMKSIGEKRKKYRCVVHCEKAITPMDLELLNTISDLNIVQLTPIRVCLRRTIMTRQRHINNINARYINPHFFYLDLETQAGTYVKEFVHSDKGRSHPSVTSILQTHCDILQLDVTELID